MTHKSNKDICTRTLKKQSWVGTENSRNCDESIALLPRPLYMALNFYGIELSGAVSDEKGRSTFVLPIFVFHLKIIIPHAALLLYAIRSILEANHLTFIISTLLDIFVYLFGLDLLLWRKRKVTKCLQLLVKIPRNSSERNATKKLEITSLFLAVTVVYATSYFIYGSAYYGSAFESFSTSDLDLATKILDMISFTSYCYIICIGMPIHLALFIYIAIQVYNKLLFIDENLKVLLKKDSFIAEVVHQQRFFFCKVQEICCQVDSIFNEIMLLWFIRIIIRGCLGEIDVMTMPWNNPLTPNVLVVLDVIFDITFCLMLCICGGKIDDGKGQITESLINMGSKRSFDHVQNDVHFLISSVGHSRIDFTVGNIFLLNRGIAVTILGAIASYCALIYQLAENN